MNCHTCKNKDCLNCPNAEETYSYKYQKYILDTYDAPAIDTKGSEKCTSLNDDIEDYLRKLLYTIFDLTPNELLCLKAIMNGKDLTEWGKDMEQLARKNETFSRFRAFQTRKSILKKLGAEFKGALITNGQRKVLKV